jgi:cytochrome P450
MDDAEPSGEPRFDPALGAWVLTRHADVSAALRDPRLSVPGTGADRDVAHVTVRGAAAHAMSPARLAAWRGEVEASARAITGRLPAGVPVDLVGAFARPWSGMLAVRATGAPAADAERLDRLAREVFLAAACATDSGSPPPAQAAVAELARRFPGAGASADVQAYVALSQTLPCALAGVWLELIRHPDEADRLRSQPELMPGAVEELLRHAGPARAVFRRASATISIGGASVAPGDRVVLWLSAANHDPARFPEPERLDVRRDAAGHLAFGAGPHSCPGAPLIRMAVAVATESLLATTSAVEPAGEAEWIGGFAIRAPATLPVVLRRDRSAP